MGKSSRKTIESQSFLCEIKMKFMFRWFLNVDDYSKRLFTGSWYTNEKPQVFNRNDGLAIPAVYKKLLNSHLS